LSKMPNAEQIFRDFTDSLATDWHEYLRSSSSMWTSSSSDS